MKSIRGRITIWLLVGLAVLWAAGGTAIYLTSRSAMLAGIDAENQGLARQVRSLSRGGGGPGWWRQDDEPAPAGVFPEGVYYQVWNLEGDVLLRSDKLGGHDLPRLKVTGESAAFETAELSPGKRVRLVATQFAVGRGGSGREGRGPRGGGGGGISEPVLVVVARDLAGVESESRKLLWVIGIIGLVVAAGTCLLLALALRDGLRPLRDLGEEVAGVNASSLHVRFDGAGMPRELQPIINRLDALMERLEAGFLRERRFSADLAHELRTPIAELRAMADLSIAWPAERTGQQMHNIRGVAKRMQNVVDTLLHLARLEGEGEKPGCEPVELGSVIDEAWRPQAKLATERGLQTRFAWPEGATLQGNPDLWGHLLENLLANAAEYAVAGGRVMVERGETSVRVVNSVTGLQEDEVERMFERFWRADTSRTGDSHSGLGLSLAKACAEAMDLQMTAALEEGDEGETLLAIKVSEASRQG